VTTIGGSGIDGIDDRGRTARDGRLGSPPREGVGSPRYWMWSSTLWVATLCGTALVAVSQLVTVGIAGMAIVGLGGALGFPDQPPDKPVPGPQQPSPIPPIPAPPDRPYAAPK